MQKRTAQRGGKYLFPLKVKKKKTEKRPFELRMKSLSNPRRFKLDLLSMPIARTTIEIISVVNAREMNARLTWSVDNYTLK